MFWKLATKLKTGCLRIFSSQIYCLVSSISCRQGKHFRPIHCMQKIILVVRHKAATSTVDKGRWFQGRFVSIVPSKIFLFIRSSFADTLPNSTNWHSCCMWATLFFNIRVGNLYLCLVNQLISQQWRPWLLFEEGHDVC